MIITQDETRNHLHNTRDTKAKTTQLRYSEDQWTLEQKFTRQW